MQQVFTDTVKSHYYLFPSSILSSQEEKFPVSQERISNQESLDSLCFGWSLYTGRGDNVALLQGLFYDNEVFQKCFPLSAHGRSYGTTLDQ